MTKIVPTEKARQGKWGWQVLVVLVVALILAMGVWFGAEMFGQSTETPQTQTEGGGLPETTVPATTPPATTPPATNN